MGVPVVRADLLKESHGGRDAHQVGAIHFLIIIVIIVGHNRKPMRASLSPLLAALLSVLDGDVGWHCFAAKWDHFRDGERVGSLLVKLI
jgi:uncharacterized membrane protein YhhN